LRASLLGGVISLTKGVTQKRVMFPKRSINPKRVMFFKKSVSPKSVIFLAKGVTPKKGSLLRG